MVASNVFGRQVVIPLTNKSGGSVAAGDVVILDAANNDAFTTTTSAGVATPIGIAQATIASNAVGPVLVEGYAGLVNVNASVTRLQYGKTHTVAKQAAASASRVAGTFCTFLSSGTTPDALVYPVDLAGAALTNPMTAVGDIIQGTTAGAPAALAAPLAGKVLTGAGVTTPLVYAYPPGYELDYVQITSNVNITGTTEGTSNTIITSSSITFDGAPVIMEFYSPGVKANNGATADISLVLRDDTGSAYLGQIAYHVSQAANDNYVPVLVRRRFTPAAGARTYSVRGVVGVATGVVLAGSGGASIATMPAYLRFAKV